MVNKELKELYDKLVRHENSLVAFAESQRIKSNEVMISRIKRLNNLSDRDKATFTRIVMDME